MDDIKAVVLAAGRSTRTYPLTVTRPKPLLPLLGSTILEHNLTQLKGLVNGIVIVIGYYGEQIRQAIGYEFDGVPVSYIEQTEQKGTGHALLCAKDLVGERFMVLNGDDVYARADIERCLQHDYCVLASWHEDVSRFGYLQTSGNLVEDIIEKPENIRTGLVNTGFYVFKRDIFDIQLEYSMRGELELTDFVRVIEEFHFEEAKDNWIPITYPWNLLEANVALLHKIEPTILGKVENGVHIDGSVFVGPGTTVKAGTYIEGPVYIGANCTIGPNAYIRPDSIILDECFVGHGTEIVDSVLFPKVFCKHRAYIGHSVIGRGVNIGAGLITADFRHDGANIITLVKDQKVNSNRQKLGAFIGDDVHLGIHTSIYPGRKIWPNLSTLPGEIITQDRF